MTIFTSNTVSCINNVCFYVPSLSIGGAEKKAIDLANGFAHMIDQVTLITELNEGDLRDTVDKKVNIFDFNINELYSFKLKKLFKIFKLVIFLNSKKPKFIFCFLDEAITIANIACIFSIRRVHLIACQTYVLEKNRNNPPLFSLAKLFGWAIRRSPAIVVPSKGVKDSILDNHNIKSRKIHIVENGVNIRKIIHLSRDDVPFEMNLASKKKIIVSVGRLVEGKNFETLIRAINFVKKQIPVFLFILGDGPLRNELQELINNLDLNDSIKLCGFTNNPFSWIKNADLYVQSSVSEGFGNSLVEAMVCSVPVIAVDADGGSVREILEFGKWGDIAKKNDFMNLAELIQSRLSSSQEVNTYQRALKYDNQTMIYSYLKICRTLN